MHHAILHQSGTNSYMPGLDGLRALSVFAVIAYHLGSGLAPGGLLGVNLFFVLSGYLITGILLSQIKSQGRINIADFWLRRIRRLYPALLAMLAGLAIWALLFDPARFVSWRQEMLASVFYASNWYLIFHEVSYFESFGPPSPLGHLWSLAIEAQFYLIWPFLLGFGVRLFQHRKWLIALTLLIALISAAAMALLYIPGSDPGRVYYGTDTRAFALMLGAIAAMLWPFDSMSRAISKKYRFALDASGIVALSIVLWMIVKTDQYETFLYQFGFLFFSIAGAVLVVVLAHPANRLVLLFGWPPICLIGKLSYGIYLWHFPVIILSSPLINTTGPDPLRSVCQIAVSILLAAASYYLIEKPIRYGRTKPMLRYAGILAGIFLTVTIITFGSKEQILAKDHPKESAAIEEMEDEIIPVASVPSPEIEEALIGEEVTVIGDSLQIDLTPVLEENLPGIIVDAEIGRQMHDAPEVIDGLREKGMLKETVIVGLGTNGAFTEKQLIKTLDCLEGAKKILLVNSRVPRPWEDAVNKALEKAAAEHSNVILIDWHSESGNHNEYFYKDGVHLNKKGAEAYCKMIERALS